MTKKKITTEVETFDVDNPPEKSMEKPEYETNESYDLPPTYREAALEWLETTKYIDDGFVCNLYKYDKHQRRLRKYQSTYHDEIPSIYDIATTYKSGHYVLYISFPNAEKKRPIKSYSFWVDEHFDRQEESIKTPVNNESQFAEAFLVVERILSLFLPLLNRPTQTNDNQDYLYKTYESVNKVLQSNMIENSKLYNDILRDKIEMTSEVNIVENDEDSPGMAENLISMFAPMLQPWISKILSGGTEGKKAVDKLKNNKMFEQLTKNNDDKRAIIQYLDKEYGKAKVSKILNQLNVTRG